MSDNKSHQVSRTEESWRLHGHFSNSVVWMVSSPLINPSVSVPRALITIGIIVTFMFHSFFSSLARSKCLSFISLSFNFTHWPAGTAKSTILQVLFFLLIIIRSGHLAEIRWSVCMSKSHWSLCVSFSRRDSGLCIYLLVKFQFLVQFSVDHFPFEFFSPEFGFQNFSVYSVLSQQY